jgi:hypothetical protein
VTDSASHKQVPIHEEIARVGDDLVALLSAIDTTNPPDILKNSVLWAGLAYLPGMVVGMRDGTYASQGILPDEYVEIARLPAGWATVLEIQRLTWARAHSDAYAAGAAFINEKIAQSFRAQGCDTGEEPLCMHIARVALHLHCLLEQVRRPDDDAPGSGNLVLMQVTAEGMARTMNEGLFAHYGWVPPVTNPAYLPPKTWEAKLKKIRNMVPEVDYDPANPAAHEYSEGARWTCAKFRSLCKDLMDEPRYLFYKNERASKVTHE